VSVHVESAGHGPPLVLLHGWALHSGLWGPLLPQLAARFRVYAVDLPGHGHSAATDPYTLDEIVAAVDRAVPTGLPLTLLGWSLGGAVAMAWTGAQPARVARLVLVGTSPRFVADPTWPHAMSAATLARFGDELAVAYRSTLQRFLSLQLHGGDQGRAALALMRKHLFSRGEPAPRVLASALDILARIDLREAATMLTPPTLVVAGDRDTLAPAAAGRWLAQAIPGAECVVIPGAGHAPFLSHPEAFKRALDGFLDGG
jgi:pimeloyl-[acyl-carrier protein] methyl ester esterase